jgi:hypothetical protein
MDEIRKAVEQYHKEKTVDFLRLFSTSTIIQMAIDYETTYGNPLHDWQYMTIIDEIIRRQAVTELDMERRQTKG